MNKVVSKFLEARRISASAKRMAARLRRHYTPLPSEDSGAGAAGAEVTISHTPTVVPRALPMVHELSPKHPKVLQHAPCAPLRAEMIRWLNAAKLPLRDLTQWRWVNSGLGEVNGLPQLRGRIVMTNGVLALLEDDAGSAHLVHYNWFIEDPKEHSEHTGDNLVAARAALAAKRAANAAKVASEALALFEQLTT